MLVFNGAIKNSVPFTEFIHVLQDFLSEHTIIFFHRTTEPVTQTFSQVNILAYLACVQPLFSLT